ncbi:phenylalanine--tRNA ligase subunit beta [Pedobacter sp. HMF7647]|uniref:Phenylalanine--tRNA ligase beta subunit n=1 Tax=Hufsiella arboris TaxID=2695275 RepID=A0A7K1YEA9_9SPHI|nr:phenylalanine--tRNA ligase subunit beta [Hufsiella arboris]MXV52943.1 phenylalanine--tRNA ligase subunit beta [Hufsiella arboris]
MKISYNWLKQFVNTDKSPEEISKILTAIGLEVESLEKVQTIPGGLEGLVIGYVKERFQHPNADRLSVTKVDVGAGEDLQIVCGAPNVAAGQKVVVATVGTTVYPLSGEPFKINKSKIRGEVSEGMICAEDEIGLGTSHAGIMVLDESATIGSSAKLFFNVEDDFLYEIGLTPNRADAASHLGVARDLAAYLKIGFTLPDTGSFVTDNHDLTIPVVVENELACPRYSSVSISGVQVKESPDWLKDKLNVIGLRPINNIVDITNYVLHGLGQPLHAFDADAISGGKVVVRNCPEGTVFKTLDGVDRKLSSEDLMICDAVKPLCIAGVFGGAESGVKDSTTNIFLESAWFNAVAVRKTSKRHGLKTDASFRFERGTDPDMTITALKYAASLIKELAGGTISSEINDFYPVPAKPFSVSISYKNVNRLIGQLIEPAEIKSILTSLNIDVAAESEEGLELKVPAYKVDVSREVDVIEEILRIYGYNNIGIPQQIRASLNYATKPDKEAVYDQVANLLSANGFYEILSNSLSKASYYEESENAVKILNPLSSDLDTMRQTLLYSGLEAIAYNHNRKNSDLKLFEFGKTYFTDGDWYKENQRFAIFITGNKQSENWHQKSNSVSFYSIKSVVDGILERLNLKNFIIDDVTDDFQFGLAYKKGDKPLVRFGKVSAKLLKKFDIDKEVFFADFDWDLILRSIKNNVIRYQEVSKYPAVRRDLSLLVDQQITFNQLQIIARRSEKNILKEVNVFDVYQGEKLQVGKKSYALSFVLQDEEKTLTDKQIEGVMQKLIVNFEKEAGAEVRK